MDKHTREHLKESPWVVTVPLILLAIPSVVSGFALNLPYGDFFGGSIKILPAHDTLAAAAKVHGGDPWYFLLHGISEPLPFWLIVSAIALAWYLYIKRPDLPAKIKTQFHVIYNILDRKYGFDDLYLALFAGGSRRIGRLFWKNGDEGAIDGIMVNGTAHLIGWVSGRLRYIQSGYLYHYAFTMIIGLIVLISVFVVL